MSSSSEELNIDLSGDIINNYNVLVELGRGSYSRVWLVYSIVDSQYYAMKVQNPEDYTEGKDEINILKKIDKNEQYINRLKDYFIETRFQNTDSSEEPAKFICSVYELCCGNLDGLGRKGKYTDGYPLPLVKTFLKQICMGLKTVHHKLAGFHGDIKPDNILLCGINNRDLQYIDYYNKCNFPKLYKTTKEEYMKEKGVKKLKIDAKLRIRKKIHEAIMETCPPVETSPYTFDEKYLINPIVKLTDFGFYCSKNEQFNEQFGTCYYQAPEIILMGECTEAVDIWALGCMLYELITGTILFESDEDEIIAENNNHLGMIINLCGEFDQSYLNKRKEASKYFHKNGKLKDITYDDDYKPNSTIAERLTSRLKKHNIDDTALVNLLVNMLKLNHSKRFTVREILSHKWLAN